MYDFVGEFTVCCSAHFMIIPLCQSEWNVLQSFNKWFYFVFKYYLWNMKCLKMVNFLYKVNPYVNFEISISLNMQIWDLKPIPIQNDMFLLMLMQQINLKNMSFSPNPVYPYYLSWCETLIFIESYPIWLV